MFPVKLHWASYLSYECPHLPINNISCKDLPKLCENGRNPKTVNIQIETMILAKRECTSCRKLGVYHAEKGNKELHFAVYNNRATVAVSCSKLNAPFSEIKGVGV